jgi:subtilisin family serine protease
MKIRVPVSLVASWVMGRSPLRRPALFALLASSVLSPWPAAALVPVLTSPISDALVENVQFRNNQFGGIGRATVPNRPSFPVGRPPRGPRGGWGVPVIVPGYFPPVRQHPPVVMDDDDDYIPPPRRRPKPPRRPPVIEVDDEPAVRRRPPRQASPNVAARSPAQRSPAKRPAAAARPPVSPPPVQAARRQPPRLPPVHVPTVAERRLVQDEVLVELKEGIAADVVARRHNLTTLSTERFTLADVSLVRYRVEGNRSARQALAVMAGDTRIASAQPNFIYALQQEKKPEEQTASSSVAPLQEPITPAVEPEPIKPAAAPEPVATPVAVAVPAAAPVERKEQYSLGKMRIDVAHQISKGSKVRIAVIDTGVDDKHPELEGVISQRFDALADVPADGDNHGTAIAGAIIAKASLQGISPASELLVARAFSSAAAKPGSNAEGTTIHILKSLDWAHAQGARVVNLSFAGPQDRLLSRALQGGTAKGMIAVAAAGNGGPKAQPLYPGADPSVIAVTATDADDKIFSHANTGSYVAVAAPGVDVIAAEPGKRYGFSSGTSVAAAHVSGLVALMLEQKADLDLNTVRAILSETALDLGPKGRDPIFGAGRIDAAAALARTMKTDAAPKR